jgi:glutaredoxin-like YruB-family protein
MNVALYTTPTCGFCHQLKSYLRQRGVSFTEYDVSRDQRVAAEMVRLSGQQGVPVSVINDQVVIGFNRPLIDRLLDQGSPEPARLGVSIAEASRIAAKKGVSLPAGAYIGRVHTGSPSAQAGLQPGDVIIELTGRRITSDEDVHRIMASARPGQSLDLIFWREGRRSKTTVIL